MSKLTLFRIPGRKDIDGQFKTANIHKTKKDFDSIFKDGTYEFGALTAKYNGFAKGSPEYNDWMKDAGAYPTYAKTTIKNIVIEAMTAQDGPTQVSITWTPSAEKAVKVSYDPVLPLYTIEIIGLPAPAASPLADRKKRSKK